MMIPIYSSSGEITVALSRQDIMKRPEVVRSIIKSTLLDTDDVLFLDGNYKSLGRAIEEFEGNAQPKLGILLAPGQTTVEFEPIRFFVKKTDKKGAVIKCHPLVNIEELTKLASDALDIPADDQQLFFNGKELDDLQQTLLQLKVKDNSVIHILDTRLLNLEPDRKFTVELQGAKYPSKTVSLEVISAMTLKALIQKAAEIYEIPEDKVVIAYCSMLLENGQGSISNYNIVENCQLKVLDEREATIERSAPRAEVPKNMLMAIHRTTSKDSKRTTPTFLIHRTNSVEWYEYKNRSQRGSIIPVEGEGRYLSERKQQPFRNPHMKSKLDDFRLQVLQSKSQIVSQDDDSHKDPITEVREQQVSKSQHSSGRASVGSNREPNPDTPLVQQYRVHSAPRPLSSQSLQQLQIDVQDLQSKHFKVTISEIDTIRQVKQKLYAVNPDAPPEQQVLIYSGKTLEDSQVVKDIANSKITSLFMMKREID